MVEYEYKVIEQKMINDVGPIELQDEICWPTGDVLIRIPKQPERSKREDLCPYHLERFGEEIQLNEDRTCPECYIG